MADSIVELSALCEGLTLEYSKTRSFVFFKTNKIADPAMATAITKKNPTPMTNVMLFFSS
jgi:hypothetical protein